MGNGYDAGLRGMAELVMGALDAIDIPAIVLEQPQCLSRVHAA
jgi:hypothetical protein